MCNVKFQGLKEKDVIHCQEFTVAFWAIYLRSIKNGHNQ